MTSKEAFELLKRYEAELSITKKTKVNYDDVISARYEIGKLVEKDTPMKLIENRETDFNTQNWYYHCPKCSYVVAHSTYQTPQILPNYCSHCGQRLDWSDDK